MDKLQSQLKEIKEKWGNVYYERDKPETHDPFMSALQEAHFLGSLGKGNELLMKLHYERMYLWRLQTLLERDEMTGSAEYQANVTRLAEIEAEILRMNQPDYKPELGKEQWIPNCQDCKFWRDKGWGEDGKGTGVCDNPKVIDQCTTISEEHLKRFLKDERDARFIAQSQRFASDFGCKHFEPEATPPKQ